MTKVHQKYNNVGNENKIEHKWSLEKRADCGCLMFIDNANGEDFKYAGIET